MHVHVLFDTKGQVLAILQPSQEPDAPQLAFHPIRGQRTARLEVPPALSKLEPHALHAAVSVKLHKDGPRLIARK